MSLLSFQCRHRFDGGFQLDVAFESDHAVTTLFGPSGSGKTSVLSTIAGFLRPQHGKVQFAGRTVLDTLAGLCEPPEKRQVGMVFQDHLLFPHLTVKANLRYGRRRRRRGHRSVDLARVLEVLEIGGLLGRYPQNLSGGERQRVALGRALLSGPELLLMDEPLASLDAPLKARVLTYLERAVAEWRIPTLFVTHAQAEVRRLADWVVVIEGGRVVAGGTPDEALSQPEPLAWKNSMGPVNLLRLEQVERRDGHAMGRVGNQWLYLPQKELPSQLPMFVQFSPIDVTLSRQDVTGLSARNHLQGRICQMVPADEAVFVAVDIGQVVWAEVTPDAVTDLNLTPGSEVTCLLKAHSLRALE
ncbi:MAG: molybdenum ABC transporter ATP-binding protein [Planctomycetota bacterium]|jgi:molybdate transport system ATP-binding protein